MIQLFIVKQFFVFQFLKVDGNDLFVCDSVFLQPLLKLNPLQVSLEDVFMELTQSDRAAEEYAEKAKKKETEDMKDAGDL